MNIKELREKTQESYGKYFTNSTCIVKPMKIIGEFITINIYLANNSNELFNGYKENDMIKMSFTLNHDSFKNLTDETELPVNMVLTNDNNNSFLTKPAVEWACYGNKKVNFRKTIGDGEKIIKTLDKFFKRLHDSIKEELEKDNIHDNFKKLVEEKLI